MLWTAFKPDVFLLGIYRLFHHFATTRAVDVGVAIPFPTFFGVTDVDDILVLAGLQLVDFIPIKSKPHTLGAAIDGNTIVSDLLHAVLALGAL